MRTNKKKQPKAAPPKPITLGVMESFSYMNNGAVPRRNCHLCNVLYSIFIYASMFAMATGFLIMLKSVVAP